jgi:hypothetical protein
VHDDHSGSDFARRNRDQADMIRTRCAQEAGAEILDVCEFELALAHLDVPRSPEPQRRRASPLIDRLALLPLISGPTRRCGNEMLSAPLSPGVDRGVAHRDSDRPDLAARRRRNPVDEREPHDPGRPTQRKQPPTGYAYKDRRSRERPVLTASSVASSSKATRGSQGIPATSSSRLPRMPPTIAAIVSVSPPSDTA